MCGLAGMISFQPNQQSNRTLTAAILAMQKRGNQSTGIATLTPNQVKPRLLKSAQPATDFISTVNYWKQLKDAQVVVGHTRLATVGVVSDENSHPFQFDRVTGAHNGSVSNWLDVDKQFNRDLKVDSQAIFALLNKNHNNFKESFSQLSGRFAISWIFNKKVYLVREENPLWLLIDKKRKSMFWISEPESLGYVYTALDGAPPVTFFEIEKNIVYEIDPKTMAITEHPDIKFKEYSYNWKNWGGEYKNGVWVPNRHDDGSYHQQNHTLSKKAQKRLAKKEAKKKQEQGTIVQQFGYKTQEYYLPRLKGKVSLKVLDIDPEAITWAASTGECMFCKSKAKGKFFYLNKISEEILCDECYRYMVNEMTAEEIEEWEYISLLRVEVCEYLETLELDKEAQPEDETDKFCLPACVN